MATVLIIDDDPGSRELFAVLARNVGHDVMTATDGEEALELAVKHRPDVVVSDVLMPRMDGFEFARRLWRLGIRPRLVFCSAHLVDKDAERIVSRLGGLELLRKPVEPEAFQKVLANAVAASPPEPPLYPAGAGIEVQIRMLNEKLLEEVTERKRFEDTLEEKDVELDRANLARDRFLARMSHELRTPLNSIIGFTSTLLMGLPGPLNDAQRSQLNAVRSGGRHLLSIIDGLVDLARIGSGTMELTLEPVDVGSVVEEVRATAHTLAEEKGLTFDVDVSKELSCFVDRQAMCQILLHLANNAITFTDAGAVRIRAAATDGSGAVRIDVVDTGRGISQEDRLKLLEPLGRSPGVAQGRTGTGLGWHLVRKMAELLGADITIESEPGRGSTFSLIVPGRT